MSDSDRNRLGIYIAEQVSHHPPITAFHYSDREGGVVIWGHAEMRSRFYGNSVAALMDHENTKVNLELPNLGETYEFNFPDLYGRGVFLGSLMTEICGQVRVRCVQNGVRAEINFQAKPPFFGRYNRFDGKVFGPNANRPSITFAGRWSAYMKATDLRSHREWLTFDVRTARALALEVPPIEEQCEFESQFAWRFVSLYLQRNDMRNATSHKSALEEKQRKERAFQTENHIEWQPQMFHFNERTRRYVPNSLNLEPYATDEVIEMPVFHVPVPIQQGYDAGITQPIGILQEQVEAQIREAALSRFT
jgi:hypothetical protein